MSDIYPCTIYLDNSIRRDKVRQTVLNAGFGGGSTHFAVLKKSVFKQKLRPKYA